MHSAYKICKNYSRLYIEKEKLSFSNFEYIETFFANINYLENPMELNKIRTNPLFLEYKDALRLAKIIYRCKSYRENIQSQDFNEIPPYIIDMSKLFELYVYTKLKNTMGLHINYQASGNYGMVDFLELNNHIVIDTKYKQIYDNEKQEYNIDDIRQVSGYARDKRLLKKLYGNNKEKWEMIVPRCLIIYPDMVNGNSVILPSELLVTPIVQFNEFYKYGIKLPEIKM